MPSDELDELPVDPDVDDVRRVAASPFAVGGRSRWPRLRADVVAAVFAGGCVGGLARYVVTDAWPPASYGFPWSTLSVNVAGAFVLGLVVVVAAEIAPSRYLRPLLGTGFCGALTTFSSIVVSVDRLLAHDRVTTAVSYLVASAVGGLAAAWVGLVLGRALASGRRAREERTSS